ncbi:MAG TPA: hypothetical protein VLX92_26750 [Kofleriaceae bacterium]|nr:hypothetical protein [Kofleriaceae bacterium]
MQIFNSYSRGSSGSAYVPSTELAYIVSPHLGLVATIPFQVGISKQTTGFQDAELLVQYLAAGSLADDAMVSVGLSTTFPTGRRDLSGGDYFVGPFAYGAKRWFHRLVLVADATALLPVVHGASTRQILTTGMVSVMVTPRRFDYPVYAQLEVDSTTYLDGMAALPPGATSSPAETVFIAPEVFIGPFKSPIDEGTRVAAGVFYNATGDPVHRWTFTLTAAFDIPNKYGY